MKFEGGKVDVRGFIKRFSRSMASHDTSPSDSDSEPASDLMDVLSEGAARQELEAEGAGHSEGVEVTGTPGNGGVDLEFRWKEPGEEGYDDASLPVRHASVPLCNQVTQQPDQARSPHSSLCACRPIG